MLRETFRVNLAVGAIVDGNPDTYWRPHAGTEQATIEVELQEAKTFDRIVLMEHIQSGQRIERFMVSCLIGGEWRDVYGGTVIGYKHICCFGAVTASLIRLTISESRWYPTLSSFGVYKEADLARSSFR